MQKKILKYYSCELILSSDYRERVAYMKEWLGGDGKSLSPYHDEINAQAYTLYVYYHPVETVIKEENLMFLGIPNEQLKKGVVYVLPGRDYLITSEMGDTIPALDLWQGTLDHYHITFVECFPYVKEDSVKLIGYLQDYFNKKSQSIQLNIIVYGTNRRYAYSDLITEESTRKEACKTFKRLFEAAQVIEYSSDKKMALSQETISYAARLGQVKLCEVKEKYNSYLSLFDMDYEWLIEDFLSLEKLETLFSYNHFKISKKNNLSQAWRHTLQKEILVPSQKQWLNLIELYNIELPYLNKEKEINKILKYLWQELDKRLDKKIKLNVVPNNELDYKVKTKNLKQQFKEILIQFFENDAKAMIQDFIQRHFEAWANILEFNLNTLGQEEYSVYDEK